MFGRFLCGVFLLIMFVLQAACGGETPTPAALDLSASLVRYDKPPDGCPAETSGTLQYQSSMSGGFTGALEIASLASNHRYTFSMNGWSDRPGSEGLAARCAATGDGVGYCDVDVQSDDAGTVSQTITIPLPPGEYNTKLLLKDAERQYCVTLFTDSPPAFEIR